MDIRTKLVFTLVAVSLASMLALGAVAFRTASGQLRENTLRQLEALAETKKDDLEKVVLAWKDRVQLIASRTQLRLSLQDYNQTRSSAQQDKIQMILEDAVESVRTLQLLTVYDVNGQPIATTDVEGVMAVPDLEPTRLPAADTAVDYEAVTVDEQERLWVGLVTPLMLEGERIGALRVVQSAVDLVDVTVNLTGLGETGETLVVLRDQAGVARIVHPVRHPDVPPGLLIPERPDNPASLALRGVEDVFSEGVIDYRGQQVWAATRYLREVDWGLVVKFDAAEEMAPILELRHRLIRLGLSLSAFAILLGTLLGLRFARPIQELAAVADRIRKGDLKARAQPRSEDEVGLLARTFNEMAEELERRIATAGGDTPASGGSGRMDRPEA